MSNVAKIHLDALLLLKVDSGRPMQEILEGYASVADADFIAAYDGLSTEGIYEHVIDLFPSRSVKVADIGAGTGRDAAWLADKGHDVLAVEPCENSERPVRRFTRPKTSGG